MKRFAYLRDPVFLMASAAYAANQFWLKPAFAAPFLYSHFNDLLLMPAALPCVLWLQRQITWRDHDRPPTWGEMFGHLAIWSIICELVGPCWLKHGTADPLDVVAYAAGGILACCCWRCFQLTPAHAHEL